MIYIVVVGVLVGTSGLFSGLTLGLMSLNPHEVKRKADLGDARAKKIYGVRKNGNRLLVTLLLGNVAAISVLSIVLDSVSSGVVAAIATTGLITIFGEIIPQAVFSRFALELGSATAPIVQVVMWLLWPVAAPLGWILDRVLGEELPTIYSRKELVGILQEHGGTTIDPHEERIARGALTFSDKRISEVMTPRRLVMGVEQDQVLDESTIDSLHESGYSRFPVYDESLDHVTGVLYAQQLIESDNHDQPVRLVSNRDVKFVHQDMPLDDVLNAFIQSKRHMFMVVDKAKKFVGIVTIEDVIEEILGVEIVDEFDKYEEQHRAAEQRARRVRASRRQDLPVQR